MTDAPDPVVPRPESPTAKNAPPRRGRRLLAVLLAVVVALVLAEGGLRVAGFSFRIQPERIDFGSAPRDGSGERTQRDPDLFWVKKGYAELLAGAAARRPRLAFLGDSCTHQGQYAQYVTERLSARLPQALPTANFGVLGYTTFQGRRQLERDVAPLAPQVVTLYYGWNDHWVGFGLEDAQVAQVLRFAGSALAELRLAQLWHKSRLAVDPRLEARPNRVPLPAFRANLRAMVRTVRGFGGTPVLITAPSAHVEGETPRELVGSWLRDPADLIPLHTSYVEAVRDVAREEEAILCDAAAHFDAIPIVHRRAQYFYEDGVHLNPAGDRELTGVLDATFREHGLVELLGP